MVHHPCAWNTIASATGDMYSAQLLARLYEVDDRRSRCSDLDLRKPATTEVRAPPRMAGRTAAPSTPCAALSSR
ncbi:hypothetical protein F4558_000441 [Micromonospora profundi]|nr:hypothetical protein [Micromonospora profundi]